MVRRHGRGVLLSLIFASVLGCFVLPRKSVWTVKPQRCSSSIKACELDIACGFWDCVQEAALRNETEANAYLKEVKVRAKHHVDFSGKVVDRGSAISAVMQSINSMGVLTFVLGGKNLGKSFLKKVAVERCQTDGKVVVLSADMRLQPGKTLLDVLFVIANQTLQEMSTKSEFQPYLAPVMGTFAAIVSVAENMGVAATPIANFVKELAVMAIPKEKVNALDVFLQMVRNTSKLSAIVVDEANLGLPGLMGGKDVSEMKAAKAALAAITCWTKQEKLSSVVLVSSEFAYPFSLQTAGLDLRDIGNVIVIGEVLEADMMKMLQEEWGMTKSLAEKFYEYFGGDIYTTNQALDSLIEKEDNFDPYAVMTVPGLPSLCEDPEARAHLENIAGQGFSLVRNVKTDRAARMIAEENVGGVINKKATTVGLPEIFTGTVEEWAVIPSTYHMRMKIVHELENTPLPSSGPGGGGIELLTLHCGSGLSILGGQHE